MHCLQQREAYENAKLKIKNAKCISEFLHF
jgi:hypothetical protein